MIDINILRTNKDWLEKKLSTRGEPVVLNELLELDVKRRKLQTEIDTLLNQRKKISSEIAELKKYNCPTDILIKQVEEIKTKITTLESTLHEIENNLNDLLLKIPNIPDDTVPMGKNDKDNIVIRQSNEIPELSFQHLPHWEIGEQLQILDLKTVSKISGTRFVMLKGYGSKLERALINFMLDEHIKKGYEEVWLPYLVTKDSVTGTGQLPKFEVELYKCVPDELYLIPTAEVSLMNIHKNEFIPEEELPKKYVSYSACFRREAGSYGKDTKGLIRNHQFNKIELVKFTKPEDSDKELESMVEDAEEILKKLGLTYRVTLLCTGELSFASAKTYDLEVWMPGEQRWREISSCSNCKDFQSRRLNIKVRYKNGRKEFVHTLNGSGVAVGRTFACILETYQQPDGTIKVPEVLRSYLGTDTIP